MDFSNLIEEIYKIFDDIEALNELEDIWVWLKNKEKDLKFLKILSNLGLQFLKF